MFFAKTTRPRVLRPREPVPGCNERFPIVFCGFDFLFARAGFIFGELCRGLVVFRVQLGRVEFDNDLARFQRVTFLGENFFDPTAIPEAIRTSSVRSCPKRARLELGLHEVSRIVSARILPDGNSFIHVHAD